MRESLPTILRKLKIAFIFIVIQNKCYLTVLIDCKSYRKKVRAVTYNGIIKDELWIMNEKTKIILL